MKKIILSVLLVFTFFLTGCGKKDENYVINELSKKIEKSTSYYIEGRMELMNNEDVYEYDVKVSYKSPSYYKVDLTNVITNHEQIILKNKDGVYVVTPSLNKSFKFQSDWPYNNSQSYLLSSILDDINNDGNKTFLEEDDGYVITTKVNYPNNQKLVSQKIYIDKNINVSKVLVMDQNGNTQIKMEFKKIDLNSNSKEEDYDLSKLITLSKDNNDSKNNGDKDSNSNTNNNTNTNTNTNTNKNSDDITDKKDDNTKDNKDTKETATLKDIIYPMYLPTNTYLTNQEKVLKDDGERLILTFSGDKSFMLIEETVSMPLEHEIIPTFGELELMGDTIAVVNDNSINWVSNGIEYYVVSDVISKGELLEVARSISVLPVSK